MAAARSRQAQSSHAARTIASVNDPLERGLYPHGDPVAARLLVVLLAQDGSTTRIVSRIAGVSASLHVYRQERLETVPDPVRETLGGAVWLERVTSLHVDGRVLMDNLTFTRLDRVPPEFAAGLERGELPVGRLLETLFTRRNFVRVDEQVRDRLFGAVGLPDARASRAYTIATADGPFMLVLETYRAAVAEAFKRGLP